MSITLEAGETKQVSVALTSAIAIPNATLADFQAEPATGSMGDAYKLNNGVTLEPILGLGINDYIIVDFGKPVRINQYRQSGCTANYGNGEFELFYRDTAGNWIRWVTFPTLWGEHSGWKDDWGHMESAPEVVTDAIKLTTTILDSLNNISFIVELEVYHS